MQIILNGKPADLPERVTAAILVDRLELGGKRVAVEVNGRIVPRSRLGEQPLADGDRVEIIHAVGGG